MPTTSSLLGRKFGRLKVIKNGPVLVVGVDQVKTKTSICLCDCGKEVRIRNNCLTSNTTKSCGCFRKEATSRNFKTHGLSNTRDYNAWNTMIQRCTNPRVDGYRNYGGRGIRVCNRWRRFENFIKDMGNRPEGLSLERLNNKRNYEPSNCVWATRKSQSRNTRRNIIYTINGTTACLVELCDLFNKNYHTTYDRLKRGLTIEQAFF